jgi:TonB family protein
MRHDYGRCRRIVYSLILYSIGIIICQAEDSSTMGDHKIMGPLLLIRGEIPLYPTVARQARLKGNVNLHVKLKEGEVASVEVRSSAALMLIESAKQNVKTWRFEQDKNGSFEVNFIYDFEKEEVIVPENPHIEMKLPFYVKITAKPVTPNTLYGRR